VPQRPVVFLLINSNFTVRSMSMSDLDKVLIDLFRKQSSDVSDKNVIPANGSVGFKKVAFDMFKVEGDAYADLWKMETIDGEDFLVRSSDELPKYKKEDAGDWTAVSNYESDNVTLSYKNVPICTFSSEDYGFSTEDVFTFKSALLDMANDDVEFIKKVVASQPKAKADAISSIFPEINKIIK